MKPLSRRCFCVSAALVPFLAHRRELSARVPNAPPEAKTDDLPAQTLYGIGARMLKEGRTFEKAAAHFTRALEKEPENLDFALALGCAVASRAASLAWAGGFAARLDAEQAAFPKWQSYWDAAAKWLKEQNESKKLSEDEHKKFAGDLEKYRPKQPITREFRIKDDKKPFRLTRAELAAELTDLNKKALAAWDKGVALAKTPAQKAEAQYVRGFGMRLLLFYLADDSPWQTQVFLSKSNDPPPFRYKFDRPAPLEIKGLPTDAQIKAALEEATIGAHETSAYWQALADYLAVKETSFATDAVTELYRRAAQLDPKNANLWNRIYSRETEYRYGAPQPDAPLALDDLHRAQTRDKANSWYGYEEAGRLLENGLWGMGDRLSDKATEKQIKAAHDGPRTDAGYAAGKRAALLVERANGLPRLTPPTYRESVPILLFVARYYPPNYWHGPGFWTGDDTASAMIRCQNMGRMMRFYAESLAADKKSVPEARRVLYVLMQVGLRLTGDLSLPADIVGENSFKQVMLSLGGSPLVSSAYRGLLKILENEKDTDAHMALTRESEAWEARVTKWLSPVQQDGVPFIYDVYDRA